MRHRLTPWARTVGSILLAGLVLATAGLPFWRFSAEAPTWWGGALAGLQVYVGIVFLWALAFVVVRSRKLSGPRPAVRRAGAWLALWHGWLGLMVACGAVLGALLFPLGRWVFGVDIPWTQAVLAGLRDGAFYFLIWAPGVSFVLCVMEAHDSVKIQRAKAESLTL